VEVKGIHGLKINRPIGNLFSLKSGNQGIPVKDGRFSDVENITDSRIYIQVTDVLIESTGICARDFYDERDPYRRVVSEKTMADLPVFPQRLPMTCGKDDHCPVILLFLLQTIKQPAQHEIDIGDFAIVKIVGESTPEWLGRLVREMGIIAVDPDKPWRSHIFYALAGLFHNLVSPPFQRGQF
jgi:hypothetical protein